MSDDEDAAGAGVRGLGATRLVIGLVQGVALYLLYRAGDSHLWPSGQPMVFAALALVLGFVPLIVIEGAGNLRAATLWFWSFGAAVLLAGLGSYDRWRLWLPDLPAPAHGNGLAPGDLPSAGLFLSAAAILFIAHTLIQAADSDGKPIARYRGYFDTGWKLGVQVVLAACFVGVFWGVLELGASLFELIKLHMLRALIEKPWFAIPASALATAAALHLTDVRAGLVAGIRMVALALLSWLLPLATLVIAGFLFSILFTGFAPLWETRSATALLLSAAALLVFLINTAWQDGEGQPMPPFLLRLGGSIAAVALVPLVAIAAYALSLRVGQHGWSEERIVAAAAIVIAACYALGYAAAAFSGSVLRAHWLRGIAPVNVATAFVTILVLVALHSPLSDPMRIAVSSQVARLDSGKVAADQFDYNYLRWEGGRFGHEALTAMAAKTGAVADKAKSALASTSRVTGERLGATEIAAQVTLYPKDQLLPPSLLHQDWRTENQFFTPPCLGYGRMHCDAFVVDMNGDGRNEYLFVWGSDSNWIGAFLGQDDKGHWSVVGTPSYPHCKAALDGLRAGQYAVVAPDPQKWRALEAGNSRFSVAPVE
ncbi:MAG: DUF4153 domain-containing protein, partial [Pseudomonadota bacterium]|nr:DUF4153 domain-containing protein [Pseudomonadota bacterium]